MPRRRTTQPTMSRKSRQKPETALVKSAIDLCRAYGARVERYNAGLIKAPGGVIRLASNGHSDIGGTLQGGRSIYLEIKVPGNKPSVTQVAFLEDMRRAGAVAFWADNMRIVESVLLILRSNPGVIFSIEGIISG